MEAQTDATHTKTLDKIHQEQQKSEANIVKAQQQINNARVKQDTELYNKRLAATKVFYDNLNDNISKAVLKGEVTEEQAEIMRLTNTRNQHTEELAEMQRFLDEMATKDYYTAAQRERRKRNYARRWRPKTVKS